MPATKLAPLATDEIKNQRIVDKYLKNYAEPESQWGKKALAQFPAASWDYVVTIPACGEYEYLPAALESIAKCQAVIHNSRVLCIVVLNGNRARETEFKLSNQNMRRWFRQHCEVKASDLNPADSCPQTLVTWQNMEILIVDHSKEPWLIPADQGVGLVRKIGADIALQLIATGKIVCPWIHNTDADARVPDDYFLRITEAPVDAEGNVLSSSCFIYPYLHMPDPEMAINDHQRYWPAVTDYELWLRYYVAGLQWAGSSYAYPSIGSLLACNSMAYAKTRGFPKKMAGEDFYFQNKLAKMGAMVNLKGAPIRLLTRPSSRVPFGTGQGTIKINKLNEAGDLYEVYHPLVFDFLKAFLSAAHEWFLSAEVTGDRRESTFLDSLEMHLVQSGPNGIGNTDWLAGFVDELQVFKNLHAAENRSTSAQGAIRQFDDWFDGFKTLKLIHRARDDLYGSLPLIEALQASRFLTNPGQSNASHGSREEWLEALRAPLVLTAID